MKVVLDMVITPNGLIAREDGSEDYLPFEGWRELLVTAKRYNNIVMGRETYQQVMERYKDSNFDDVSCDSKIIVSRNEGFLAPRGYTVVNSPEAAFAFLEHKHIDSMLLLGGGRLNAEFLKHRLINEIHLTIDPYIIGRGRPFLYPDKYELSLELQGYEQLSGSRMKLRYKVVGYI